MADFRLTTKVQVSGWRFLLRRVEHAIVRRDTRMFDDPLQFYSRSVSAGIVVAVLVCLGAAMMAYFKPQGKRGEDTLLVDRSTNQLYVVMPGTQQIRPVYNLTSARLVLGHSGEPQVVKPAELSKMSKGQPIGIPGAPYATPVNGSSGTWSVCDTVTKPESVTPTVETSVLVEPVVLSGGVAPIRPDQGVLVKYQDKTWLITKDGRHAIDLADRALTSAVGIPVGSKSAPISSGLFNALPNVGPWALAPIPAAGAPNTVGLPPNLVNGTVFQTVTDNSKQQYVVLPDGVAKVNETTAAALRATNSYGLISPPSVESSVVAKIPEQTYTSPLPAKPMTMLLPQDDPTVCWTWQREAGDQGAKTTVIVGRHLPIPATSMGNGIKQISGDATVYIDGGQYIRLQSPDPRYGEAQYYVDAQGVRYGIANDDTAKALGLTGAVTAPWQVVGLLMEGPVLSKEAALLEHDTLPSDPKPRKVAGGNDAAPTTVRPGGAS
jgi:type VII secretion protein EccB